MAKRALNFDSAGGALTCVNAETAVQFPQQQLLFGDATFAGSVAIFSGGGASNKTILQGSATAVRIITFPDVAGTVALTGQGIIGEVRTYAGYTTPSGWLLCYGQSVLRSTYAALFAALTTSHTVTFSNGTGDLVCNWTGHPFAATGPIYTPISFTAGTSTPTGITAGTVYFVLPLTSSTFRLSTTAGGSAIAYTNSGTGTQTATALFYGAADSTHFNLPDCRGRVLAGLDNMGGSAASRLVNLNGSITGPDVLGGSGGEQTHALISSEISTGIVTFDGGTDVNTYDSDSVANAHNNVQPTLCVNVIIFSGV
jgi:microcystin-dependent protein